MKQILKFLCLTGIFLALSINISGCNKQSSNNNPKIKELEFWTLQLSEFSPYMNNIISSYEKLHPDVHIKWIDIPFSEGEKRALAAVMSSKVPDVINMNPSFASTLASRGALLNLKPYVSKEQYNEYLNESWQSSELNKILFGVPWYITSSITIYNSEMLENARLNPNKPPQTFKELGEYAKIIKEKTGKYAFMPNLTEDGQMIKIFNKNNISILNADKTKAIFDNEEAINELNFWTQLYKNDYIPPESLTQTHRASLERYQSGESAILIAGANLLKTIKKDAPEIFKKTRIAPQITGKNGKIDFALMNLVIPIKSAHPKEAVDFALYVTNAQNQLELCKLAPILPSTIKTINSDFFKPKTNKNILEQGQALSANQLKRAIKPIPALNNQKDLFEIIDFATQQALLGETTTKKALEQAVKDWNKILKDN